MGVLEGSKGFREVLSLQLPAPLSGDDMRRWPWTVDVLPGNWIVLGLGVCKGFLRLSKFVVDEIHGGLVETDHLIAGRQVFHFQLCNDASFLL